MSMNRISMTVLPKANPTPQVLTGNIPQRKKKLEEDAKSILGVKYDRYLDQYQIKSLRGSGCFLKIDKKIVNC